MELILILLALFLVAPAALSFSICEQRNRNPWKGVTVTVLAAIAGTILLLFFWVGWLVPLFLWLGLKRRSITNPTILY